MKKLPSFDKYEYYLNAVQDPGTTLDFLERVYREKRGDEAKTLREDFCGTFAMCCAWIERDPRNKAIGVDISREPIVYGFRHYATELKPEEKPRLQIIQADVRRPGLPKADIISALNFSYFIFKERAVLLDYFRRCRETLTPKGVFVLDCFGGSECLGPIEEETEYDDFTYYWDQESYNPISHQAKFAIHFKRPGEKKRRRVFRYDWRMWTIAEIRDLMAEAGFSSSHVYWEGTDGKGNGTGKYRKATRETSWQAWVAYVVGHR